MFITTQLKHAGIASALLLMINQPASAQNAPVDTLVKTAAQWAVMADGNQTDRMWEASGPIMQKNINKQDWANYLGNLRGELGTIQGRDWIQIARVVNPSGLPAGEYVNILFNSRFSRASTIEKVSLTQMNGKWIPVGYVVNAAEPAPQTTIPSAGGQKR